MVAFHFQFSNQAGWKCDTCRKSGLEKRRRCGWLGGGQESGGAPVWARNDVVLHECPRSHITAESECLVEDYLVRRRLGGLQFSELTARQAEAFLILEKALLTEMKHGQQDRRAAAR